MVQFNFSERTIKAKVVYYGPAQSGKTTNLEQIHRLTDPEGNNRLISLNTAQDRTLFFDLLPFSLGAVWVHGPSEVRGVQRCLPLLAPAQLVTADRAAVVLADGPGSARPTVCVG